jgi:hypothetical protein
MGERVGVRGKWSSQSKKYVIVVKAFPSAAWERGDEGQKVTYSFFKN